MNVDKNPAYPAAMEALKAEGTLPRRVRLRQCKYLNNIVEQDHRTVKKRVWLAKGYGSFQSAWRTLQGIETMHMINKGRVRWLAKGDAVGQAHFVASQQAISALICWGHGKGRGRTQGGCQTGKSPVDSSAEETAGSCRRGSK